jgi:elongation factor G
MADFATDSIRTVAWVGDGGAGKTTLVEALLAKAGAIQAAGSVERGSSVWHFVPLE